MRGEEPGDLGVRIASRADDDEVGAVDGGPEVGRRQLDAREALEEPLDLDAAARADVSEAGIVHVVQAHAIAREGHAGDERASAETGADDGAGRIHDVDAARGISRGAPSTLGGRNVTAIATAPSPIADDPMNIHA